MKLVGEQHQLVIRNQPSGGRFHFTVSPACYSLSASASCTVRGTIPEGHLPLVGIFLRLIFLYQPRTIKNFVLDYALSFCFIYTTRKIRNTVGNVRPLGRGGYWILFFLKQPRLIISWVYERAIGRNPKRKLAYVPQLY
jgi:hypothetical protein